MSKQLILILGGARSGKSRFAEHLARQHRRVLFVATAEASDEDMARRIQEHKLRRPSNWSTVEEPLDVASAVQSSLECTETGLVDCLTVWVSNLLLDNEDCPDAQDRILDAVDRLMDVYESSSATWIVVSNEVGLDVVPPNLLGRLYRDILGRVNLVVAARADRVCPVLDTGVRVKTPPAKLTLSRLSRLIDNSRSARLF